MLKAIIGRRMPLRANSPTGSTVTAFSTFVSTRGLIKICPGFASSQSREAIPPIERACVLREAF